MKRILNLMCAGLLGVSLFVAGSASAQQGGFPVPNGVTVDLNKKGAAMAMPFLTSVAGAIGASPDIATVALITNTKTAAGPVKLHFEVISGDDGVIDLLTSDTVNDAWTSFDFDCVMTPGETHQFTFTANGPDQSILTYECSTLDAQPDNRIADLNLKRSQVLPAAAGILWVTQVDPVTGATLGGDILEGKSIVMAFQGGFAFELAATTYQGLAGLDDDQRWRFDGNEFPNHAKTLTTSFIAPDRGDLVLAFLLLWTLDGTLATGFGTPTDVPNPAVNILYYNDDEVVRSTGTAFKCFALISLSEIAGGALTQTELGSQAGHLDLRPVSVDPLDDNHETNFGNGDASRIFPIDGHLIQIVVQTGQIQTAQAPGAIAPGVNNVGAAAAANAFAWAGKLTMSNTAHMPAPGDRAVLSKGN